MGSYSLQRSSRFILQPQLTGQSISIFVVSDYDDIQCYLSLRYTIQTLVAEEMYYGLIFLVLNKVKQIMTN